MPKWAAFVQDVVRIVDTSLASVSGLLVVFHAIVVLLAVMLAIFVFFPQTFVFTSEADRRVVIECDTEAILGALFGILASLRLVNDDHVVSALARVPRRNLGCHELS